MKAREGWILATLCSISVMAWSADIETSVFFADMAYEQVALSPKGKLLAVVVSDGLVVIDLDKMKSIAATKTGFTSQTIRRIWWIGNDRILFDTKLNLPGQDQEYITGSFYSINADGTNIRQVLGTGPGAAGRAPGHDIIHLLPDNDREVLVQRRASAGSSPSARRRPEAFKQSVRGQSRQLAGTKRPRGLVKSPLLSGNLYADNSGAVRLAQGRDAKTGQLRLMYRDDRSVSWRNLSEQFSLADDGIMPVGFTGDNQSLYYLTVLDGNTTGLVQYDFSTGKHTRLFHNATFDLSPGDIVWNSSADKILGVKFMGDYPEKHYFDPKDGETLLRRKLDRFFPAEVVRVVSSALGGTRLIFSVSSDRNPGAFYLWDSRKNKYSLLIERLQNLSKNELAEVQPFALKSTDGIEIHGYLTLPRAHTGEGLPLVVLPHGGPHHVRSRWGFDREAQFLAHHGYAVMHVNFRGSFGFGDRHRKAGFRQWGDGVIDDLVAATRWAVQQKIMDAGRVCILGTGFGGFAALATSARSPDLFRCAIGLSGIYDLGLTYGGDDIPMHPGGLRYLEQAIGRDETLLKQYSPAYTAASIEANVFLIHGDQDPRAPMAQGNRMRDALRQADRNFEWLDMGSLGGGLQDEATRVQTYDRILSFLNEQIGSDVKTLIKHESTPMMTGTCLLLGSGGCSGPLKAP